MTPEQTEQEIEQFNKVFRELSDRVTHLQRRVNALEQTVLEDEVEQVNPKE